MEWSMCRHSSVGGLPKFSPSTAKVSITRKLLENFKLLCAYVEASREPVDLDWLFSGLAEYQRLLDLYTGHSLQETRVLEIGYGARPWRLLALISMGVDAWGVDVEVPFLSGTWQEVSRAFRENGLERATKSLIRHALFDHRERSALGRELNQRGQELKIDKTRFIVSDAAKLQLPTRRFNLIFSEDVFEHITEPSLEAVTHNMARWLRPDGIALIRPNVFTGIIGGHSSEWTPRSLLDPKRRRKAEPWEHLRARRFPPNTYLNEFTRAQYRHLFSRHFTIVNEVVSYPCLGREFLTDEVAAELSEYPEEELFSNNVLFVLRPACDPPSPS